MPKEKDTMRVTLDWLSSLKLTLSLFFILAAASVIGTLLPQGAGLLELKSQFGSAAGSLIEFLALNNVYHSVWFRILLLLLGANLVACTMDRLPKTIRTLRKPEGPFDSQKLSRFSVSNSIGSGLPLEETQSVVENAVSETFGGMRRVESTSFCAVSEKGRWSRYTVHVVHLSVLVILAGGLVGSYLGFKGSMNLVAGQTSDKILLAGGRSVQKLPFAVQCDNFVVSFYNNGAPKEFRSNLAIIEHGRRILKKSIVVNDPLTYEGITFYQASYGTVLKKAVIELTDHDSGKKIVMSVPFQEPVTIPGTEDQLMIADYQENLMGFGQAIEVLYGKNGHQASDRWILIDRPYHGNTIGKYMVRVTKTDKTRFTGLEVKKDPGVWVVWAGFMLITIAVGLTFYSSHRKVWVCIEPGEKGKRAVVTIAGRASRNAQGFEEKFEILRAMLEKRLKKTPSARQGGPNPDKKGRK